MSVYENVQKVNAIVVMINYNNKLLYLYFVHYILLLIQHIVEVYK